MLSISHLTPEESQREKQRIRAAKREERNALESSLRDEYSLQACENISNSFEFLQADILHCYIPFGSELNTWKLIELAWSMNKKVLVPVVATENTFESHLITTQTSFVTNRFGIKEPVNSTAVNVSELSESKSLVVVPMLAFNQRLFRLGYGKGMYDLFLSSINSLAFGIAFSIQFNDEFPIEKHDISLDSIFTEQGRARPV